MSSDTYGGFAIVYDEIMEPIDYDGWFSFVMEAARRAGVKPLSLLDIACGTGAVSIRAAGAGLAVTGVDRSESMLAQASRKALAARFDIPFYMQDMRALSLTRLHDLAVCLFDSVNYMLCPEDLESVFNSVREALSEDGIFIFDLVTRKKAIMVSDRPETGETENCFFVFDSRFSPRTDLLSIDANFFVSRSPSKDAASKVYIRYREVHDKRVYDSETVTEALVASGFRGCAVCSGFAFKRGTQRSERHIFVCSRTLDSRELSSRLLGSSVAVCAAEGETSPKYPVFEPGS